MDESRRKYTCGLQLVENGMLIRRAATKEGMPFEIFRSRSSGEVPVACHIEPTLIFLSPGVNRGLLQVIGHRAARALCVQFAELRFLIRKAAIVSSSRPVTPTFPDRIFVQRWSKQHSRSITFRQERVLEGCRAEASTVKAMHYYYDNLEAALDSLMPRDRPSQIWNCDKRAFALKFAASNAPSRQKETLLTCGAMRTTSWSALMLPAFTFRQRISIRGRAEKWNGRK
ncbi:hypothetical protein PF004_g24041 [Phytophthora fragariae]|uniref:Uncharacterized protein n=1 Tax=Phytophthora fragariae TaxID=53985 RepID=A0A6G0MWA4_9STRA|nr:hypothetical protein PF004_g24041 [Phytophthora fragariae]